MAIAIPFGLLLDPKELLLLALSTPLSDASESFVSPLEVGGAATQEAFCLSHVLPMGQVHVESLSLQLPPEFVQSVSWELAVVVVVVVVEAVVVEPDPVVAVVEAVVVEPDAVVVVVVVVVGVVVGVVVVVESLLAAMATSPKTIQPIAHTRALLNVLLITLFFFFISFYHHFNLIL
jgi:hypothetical protein